MAKLINWNNFNKGFGESFLYALENERKRLQDQQQFNQKMEFENRQLDLYTGLARERNDLDRLQHKRLDQELNFDMMKNLLPSEKGKSGAISGADWEKRTGRDLFTPEQEKDFYSLFQESIPKPITQSRLKNYQGGVIEEQFQNVDGKEIITGYENIFSPDRSGSNNERDRTPYFDLTKSGLAFNKYKDLQSGTWVKTPDNKQGFNVMIDGKPLFLTQDEIESLKKQQIKDIQVITDDEARQINSKVPGFYSTYQALLNMIKSPDEIDAKVNKYLSEVSTETRDAIKTLLRRRIFE